MSAFSRRRFLRRSAVLAAGSAGCRPLSAQEPVTPPAAPPPPSPPKDPYSDAVLVKGEPPLPADGAFTIIALPDTQNYSERYPETFVAQTEWIAAQKEQRRIACVLHLGDITNRNTPEQWDNAAKAMRLLDGRVPYFMAPGNHDYGTGGSGADRITHFNQYFPPDTFRRMPTFGGFYDREPDRVDNSYHLFDAGSRQFLVLCLEFGPRRDVVRWAGEIAAKHRDREAILVTHAFMYDNDTRYDWRKYGSAQEWNPHVYGMAKATGGDVTDGEELWQRLVAAGGNFIFTINGHVLHDGLGRLTSLSPQGRDITQMLVNFQMRPNGGDGWLRVIEMSPDRSMHVCDFSPTRGERNESPQNRFALPLDPVAAG